MTVVVINKSPWGMETLRDVTSITYANASYTITNASGSKTYSMSNYTIMIVSG